MARISEIPQGQQFSRSANDGVISDAQTRVFRVLKDSVYEYVNIPQACGVSIGQPHPQNAGIYCTSFDGKYEGDSRMVLVCTFQYASNASSGNPSEDKKSKPPDIRPANWATSSVTYEVPASAWKKDGTSTWVAPANPVGDRYDGATKMEPLITFSIDQYEATDPTKNLSIAGVINEFTFTIGSFSAPRHTLMFKGVQSQPVAEPWGDQFFRGWKATYEFVYKRNYVDGLGAIGWDIAIPQTGFNVRAFVPPGGATDDPYGQPLRHSQGKIVPTLLLPETISAGDKVRGMVKVFEYENGGASQLPCAQPIPLNDNGRPRDVNADPQVLVYRYQVQEDCNFADFGLRLF